MKTVPGVVEFVDQRKFAHRYGQPGFLVDFAHKIGWQRLTRLDATARCAPKIRASDAGIGIDQQEPGFMHDNGTNGESG